MLEEGLIQHLEGKKREYEELLKTLSDTSIFKEREKIKELLQKKASLEPLIRDFKEFQRIKKELDEVMQMAEDKELAPLVKEEAERLSGELARTSQRIKERLFSEEDVVQKNVIMEIRAGAGGEESAIFVQDLFRMYVKYAQSKGWKISILSSHPTGLKGFKEIIFLIEGKDAYKRLQFESGVHRVQRVPITESGGRIHTSTATVAVLQEADEVDVKIEPKDIRVDVFRAGGPGGQHVNTTDSAVRITHIPTGIVVTCQDEKSQHKNKEKALKVLRARLLEKAKRERQEEIAKLRRTQIGRGERSEKVRTYNFLQKRVTDHRISLSLYTLPEIMDGALDPIIDALFLAHQQGKLYASCKEAS